MTDLVIAVALSTALWCGGAHDQEQGTNFGPCPDFQSTTQQFQAGDGPNGEAGAGESAGDAGASTSGDASGGDSSGDGPGK